MQVEKSLNLNLNDFVTWIGFSPDNKRFLMASGLYGHSAVLVDVASGTVIADTPIVAKQGFDIISDYLKYWEKLSFHPSSRFFMGANQKLVRFWDTKSGQQIAVITDGRDPAAFSGNGKFLVTTDKDKKSLSLWEVETHVAFAQTATH
jgi:WD40 repeat protein